MNIKDFEEFVEHDKVCDQALLDNTIKKALAKAKDDKIDFKKIFGLTGAFAAVALLFLIMDIEPSTIEIDAETFHEHFINFANTMSELFGRY